MTSADPASMSVSVVTVADHADSLQLARLIESVANQSMADVELVFAFTPGADPQLVSIARTAGGAVRVVECADRDRALALDQAVTKTQGELIVWAAADALLEPGAVEAMVEAVKAGADLVYGDHAVRGSEAKHALKPDFSPERLRSHDYVTPVLMASRELHRRSAVSAGGVDGAELHDVALRLTEVAGSVVHIPELLSRVSPTSAISVDGANQRAVEAHCARVSIGADVIATSWPGIVRVVRHLADRPVVSIVIPTR